MVSRIGLILHDNIVIKKFNFRLALVLVSQFSTTLVLWLDLELDTTKDFHNNNNRDPTATTIRGFSTTPQEDFQQHLKRILITSKKLQQKLRESMTSEMKSKCEYPQYYRDANTSNFTYKCYLNVLTQFT